MYLTLMTCCVTRFSIVLLFVIYLFEVTARTSICLELEHGVALKDLSPHIIYTRMLTLFEGCRAMQSVSVMDEVSSVYQFHIIVSLLRFYLVTDKCQ